METIYEKDGHTHSLTYIPSENEVTLKLVTEISGFINTDTISIPKEHFVEIAKAALDKYSEWLPIEDAPTNQMHWIKYDNGYIVMDYVYSNTEHTHILGYQPINQPKP